MFLVTHFSRHFKKISSSLKLFSVSSTCIAGVRFSITQNVSYYIFISSFETLYFKKRQKLWIFWLNIAKIGASWVVLELSQQLIFQLIHMGNRVTCIGVFNENIVCFWRFLRWTDQKWPKKYNNWPAGLRKISRQQYQWYVVTYIPSLAAL